MRIRLREYLKTVLRHVIASIAKQSPARDTELASSLRSSQSHLSPVDSLLARPSDPTVAWVSSPCSIGRMPMPQSPPHMSSCPYHTLTLVLPTACLQQSVET